jgi:hypothetical protein
VGERINELEDAFRTFDLPSELADRVRKAVTNGFSPATVQGLSDTGVPRDVLDRALSASEEYQREKLAPRASSASTAVAEAPPLEPTPPTAPGTENPVAPPPLDTSYAPPPARVADPPPSEPPLDADDDTDDGGWHSLVS